MAVKTAVYSRIQLMVASLKTCQLYRTITKYPLISLREKLNKTKLEMRGKAHRVARPAQTRLQKSGLLN